MDSVDNSNFVNKSLTLLRTRLMGWFFWSQFFELAANRRIEMRWENRVQCLEWELWYYFQFSSWLFWLWASICSEFWTELSQLSCPSDIAFLVDCRQLFVAQTSCLSCHVVIKLECWSPLAPLLLFMDIPNLPALVVLTSHLPVLGILRGCPSGAADTCAPDVAV